MPFTPEQQTLIFAGLVGVILAFLALTPLYLRARTKQLIANGEAATIKSKAEAAKEALEVDGLKFVLQVAQQQMKTSDRLAELEREVAAGKFREMEKDRLVEVLTSDLNSARAKIAMLETQVVQLTTELNKYKLNEGTHEQPTIT